MKAQSKRDKEINKKLAAIDVAAIVRRWNKGAAIKQIEVEEEEPESAYGPRRGSKYRGD